MTRELRRSFQRGFFGPGPALWGPGNNSDPYWSNVQLLLKFLGADGSTSIVDSSPTPKVITVGGNARISTAQPLFSESVGYFDGSSNTKLTTPVGSAFDLTGDFTWDCWVWFTSVASFPEIVSIDGAYGTHAGHGFGVNGGGKFAAGACAASSPTNTSASTLTSTTSAVAGRWYFLEWNKGAGSYRLFVDGAQEATRAVTTAVAAPAGRLVTVGGYYDNTERLSGYVKDLRFSRGVVRNLANYTRPAAPAPVG